MSFLPAKTLYFGDSQPTHPQLGKRLAHIIQLEWFNHGLYFFHDASPLYPLDFKTWVKVNPAGSQHSKLLTKRKAL
jgi:hypothetical protein